ncbi:hypothetical protein MPSEU_000474800 [Mayamaea pseudoterrestris]|nr:hypothetical protein MPSEU_000474800 [Mayamaea pseudoterrestris]
MLIHISSPDTIDRRQILAQSFIRLIIGSVALQSSPPPTFAFDHQLPNFPYRSDWKGTSLPLLIVAQAATLNEWTMARWPDPILRRPADPVPNDMFSTEMLRIVCSSLKDTARREKAIGMAAQQCGINARIVFLDEIRLLPLSPPFSIVMINPRIVRRSAEVEMKIWAEHCLVLPPTFVANVLRDANVEIEYQNIDGMWMRIRLSGEAARCAQHELDHDRGILVTDHVGLEDMESDCMRLIEAVGHDERMALAFERRIDETFRG